MNYLYTKTINTVTEGMDLFRLLAKQGKIFHCEEDARDVSCFTREEGEALNDRMEECYELDWTYLGLECPCDAAMNAEAIQFLNEEYGSHEGEGRWNLGRNLHISLAGGIFYLELHGGGAPTILADCSGSQIESMAEVGVKLSWLREG